MRAERKISSLKIKQQVLYVLIFTFVTVVVWIGGSLFRSQRRTGIARDLLILAEPLNPTINTDLLGELEVRKNYSDNELATFQIYKVVKSRDGRLQQVVPIESQITELQSQQPAATPRPNAVSPSSNVEGQVGTGTGTFDQQLTNFPSPTPQATTAVESPSAQPTNPTGADQ